MNRLYSPGAAWHLFQDRKWLTGYILLFLLLTLSLGLIAFLDTGSGIPLVPEILQWIAFLLLGSAHLFFFRRRLVILKKKILLFSQTGWYLTGLLSLQLLILLSSLYFFSGAHDWHMTFISISAFILPYIVSHAWFVFYSIPAPEYKIWFNPDTMYPWGTRMRLMIPVSLKIRRRYFDLREELFTVTAPAMINLGSLFHQFILDQEKNAGSFIELADEDQQPYGWEFYSSHFNGRIKIMLDPDKTLNENKVKKNNVIIVRRVRMEEEAIDPNNQTTLP